jgi:hypothetical protein
MVLSSAPEHGASPLLIEGSLTAIAIAVAFCWPRVASSWFSRIERAFRSLALRKRLSIAVVGFAAFLLRLAILPLSPIPKPFMPNDFSFLLAAETFSSARITNATPVMWEHFETLHITMQPTYMSMYFPAQGLVMAAGKVVTGNDWYGILITTALMCSAIVWMLQAWLPPPWALLGGLLAILRLGLFSYWIDSYSGAGSISALGGALLLGALPRFMKKTQLRDGVLMAIGFILLGTSRLYEGMLLALPVLCFLSWWIIFGKNRPTTASLIRGTAIPLALIVAAGVWMGYYNYRVFGSPTTLPYTVDRAQYAVAPYFVWQSQRPEPFYRHEAMRKFYERNELDDFKKIHSVSGFVPQTLLKMARAILFYAGIILLMPLIMLRRVFLDSRIRFLVVCVMVLIAGQLIEIYLVPHYVAPFTAAFYAIGLQAMRHLRFWTPGDQPVGIALVRLTIMLCIFLAGVRLCAEPLRLDLPLWPVGWTFEWYGHRFESGAERARIAADLAKQPEKALVFVRYSPDHQPSNEWVYNAANIDSSKVIWAREMEEAENLQLIHYYKDRTVWLVQPDSKPASLSLYPSAPGQPVNVGR